MLDQLKEKIQKYIPNADLSILDKAFIFAKQSHRDQLRASGEPFIKHPLEVAKILVDLRMDVPTICASLLHDTVEDTKVSIEDVKDKFGDEIAKLVDGVTKLSVITPSREEEKDEKPSDYEREEKRAKNLRKIFLAMAKDIRVILIKLADRLHNMRTLNSLTAPKRKIIAKETLEIYAPLTSRLGLWNWKWELEDLSFSFVDPVNYKNLVKKIAKKRIERERVINDSIAIIHQKINEIGIQAKVEGRPKHLYSIYLKMNNKGKEFSEIYDLFAIRIIVNTIGECYATLGAIHGLWMPIKDRIKDYIAKPKSNNYKSLHTTVFGPGEHPLEIQIRTREMHRINEFGIAAHWAYKEGMNSLNQHKEVLSWLSRILDWQNDSKDAIDYIQNLKLDILKTQVFVFTPKGDVVDLPANSTPIDFAFRIHTDIGYHCVGAKVNTRIVPLDYQLQNGDIVEVITSKHSTPSLDWLKICKSNHARNKIRQWLKKEKREENIALGYAVVEKELKRQRMDKVVKKEEHLFNVAKKLKFQTVDDLMDSIGYGETALTTVFNRLKDELPKEETLEVELSEKPKPRKARISNAVSVKGVDNLMIKYSRCCAPVYGDQITGYVTLGKGVSIHRTDCPNLATLQHNKDRIVEASWISGFKGVFSGVEIDVEGWDRPGILRDVIAVVSSFEVPVNSCKAFAKKEKAVIKLSIEVSDISQLENIMQKIKKEKDIIKVSRISHTKIEGES